MATFIEKKQGVQEANSRVASIFTSFFTLQYVVTRFEETIRKRWAKKSSGQREALLLKVWPDIPSDHRPDLRAYRYEDEGVRKSNTKFRTSYLWPHLNLQDLKTGINLMRLLNARGRYAPAAFTATDLESCHVGNYSQALPIVFLIGYEMEMTSPTPDKYGKITPFSSAAHDNPQGGTPFSIDAGLKILEIQDGILKFLLKFCRAILHDKKLFDESVPVQPEPAPLVVSLQDLSAATMAITVPYSVPYKADLEQIGSLVFARLSEAQEHLWALREDPAYFAEYAVEWSEHSPVRILERNGRRHSALVDPNQTHLFWDNVIGDMILATNQISAYWFFIAQQLRMLISQDAKPNPDKNSAVHIKTIKDLKDTLDYDAIPAIMQTLTTSLPPSPSTRELFHRDSPERNLKLGMGERVLLRDRLDPNDDLLWAWSQMGNFTALNTCGFESLTYEFERLLLHETQRRRISALVTRLISDMGLLAELRNQLKIYDPSMFMDSPILVSEEYKRSGISRPLEGSVDTSGCIRFGKDGDPTSGRFYYPVARKRTRETNKAMQRAEKNLDDLWYKWDKALEQRLSKRQCEMQQDLLPRGRKLLRTEDWVEPKTSTSKLDSDTKDDSKRCFDIPIIKTKIKTKGVSNPPEAPTTQAADAQPIFVEARPRFKINWRTDAVFKILFNQPSTHAQPGEVQWTEFLRAMREIGFASRKLYGSVWQFSPADTEAAAKLGTGRGINFHEPHPDPKIPFHIARRIGRRLTRAYGIEASSFEAE